MSIFHPLEVVGRACKTHLQVGENLNEWINEIISKMYIHVFNTHYYFYYYTGPHITRPVKLSRTPSLSNTGAWTSEAEHATTQWGKRVDRR